MRRSKRRFAALVLPALLASAWTGGAGQEAGVMTVNAVQGENVTTGTWGGDRIRLEVTEDGAKVEYDCGHGTIDHRLTTEGDGRFRAKGTHVSERGGPEGEEEREEEERRRKKGVPATYSGRTDGKTMTLTVKLAESNETLGPFTLTYGRKVRLTKCL
jgi:hypothetical protein